MREAPHRHATLDDAPRDFPRSAVYGPGPLSSSSRHGCPVSLWGNYRATGRSTDVLRSPSIRARRRAGAVGMRGEPGACDHSFEQIAVLHRPERCRALTNQITLHLALPLDSDEDAVRDALLG